MKKTNTTAESERLSEIREILFGSNMSEYEKRFQKIEERLVEEAAQLKEETRKQFGILEKYTKNEIELLIAQAKKEQTERQLSIRKLNTEFDEFRAEFAGTRDEINQAFREIRSQILEQSKQLNDEMQAQLNIIRQLLNSHVEQLQTSKTDRTTLAMLLNDMAMKISGDTSSDLEK